MSLAGSLLRGLGFRAILALRERAYPMWGKEDEWTAYCTRVSSWEIERYITNY